MEKQLKDMSGWAILYEIPVPEMKQLATCSRESRLLKTLWDYIYVVRTSVDRWKSDSWKETNIEKLEFECKIFIWHIHAFDKEIRSWNAYVVLEETVRNLIASFKVWLNLCNSHLDF